MPRPPEPRPSALKVCSGCSRPLQAYGELLCSDCWSLIDPQLAADLGEATRGLEQLWLIAVAQAREKRKGLN